MSPRITVFDGPAIAARYWGVTQQEYYERADVWPLAPQGEILVVIQIEDTVGIKNLPDMLKNVPGIGAVLIGEGDLSQELGFPRQYEHKAVLEAMAEIVAAEASHNVIVGHLTASLLRLMRDNLRRNLSELMQVPAARDALLEQHRAVWRAIEQGDADQALAAAANHIGYVRQNLTRILRSDFRPIT